MKCGKCRHSKRRDETPDLRDLPARSRCINPSDEILTAAASPGFLITRSFVLLLGSFALIELPEALSPVTSAETLVSPVRDFGGGEGKVEVRIKGTPVRMVAIDLPVVHWPPGHLSKTLSKL